MSPWSNKKETKLPRIDEVEVVNDEEECAKLISSEGGGPSHSASRSIIEKKSNTATSPRAQITCLAIGMLAFLVACYFVLLKIPNGVSGGGEELSSSENKNHIDPDGDEWVFYPEDIIVWNETEAPTAIILRIPADGGNKPFYSEEGFSGGTRHIYYGPFHIMQEARVVKFTPIADMNAVHHMIIQSDTSEIFAWARTGQVEPLAFDCPEGTGFHFMPGQNWWLNIHFEIPTEYVEQNHTILAGFELTLAPSQYHEQDDDGEEDSNFPDAMKDLATDLTWAAGMWLPPKEEDVTVQIICEVTQDIQVFAYRNHAHMLGRQIYSHIMDQGQITIFGNRSAQEPQIFQHLPNPVTVHKNSVWSTTCHYSTVNENHYIITGDNVTQQHDEMCNQWFMYTPPPPDNGSTIRCYSIVQDLYDATNYHVDASFTSLPSRSNTDEHGRDNNSWGQIAGVAHSDDGTFGYVFARRSNTFGGETTIQEDTIFVIDMRTDTVASSFGGNGLFITPHGLHVDHWGYIWTTDTSTHQVLKLDPSSGDVLLTLGERETPGSDNFHFDQPTDVAVATTGEIYVSDGYGNSRVMVFNPSGEFLYMIGGSYGSEPGSFVIPHNIALDEDNNVYVADRENSRVQVFKAYSEAVVDEWNSGFTGRQVSRGWGYHFSAISYSAKYQMFFSVEGSYLVLRTKYGSVVGYFGTDGSEDGQFLWPHDVSVPFHAADPSLDRILVGELDGFRVQQFVK